MPTLTDLTQFVTFHSAAAQEHLWEWFSAQVYALILTAEQDSLLVRVRQRFSLQQVVAACAGYRLYDGGAGQAADYPVVRLCWALLLRYLCGWSLRVLEHELRVNLLVRWCTHFALQEQTPDHTTLWRFENWLRQHALDVLFVVVLEQIDVDFPDEAHALQCGDTFGVRAKIADVSLNTLLRQSCRRLLLALEAALPAVYGACVAQVDLTVLFGADDERPEQQWTPAAKDARTLVTACAAADWLAVVQAVVPVGPGDATTAAALAQLRHWCDVVAKILADNFTDQPLPPAKTNKRAAATGAPSAPAASAPVASAPAASAPVASAPVASALAAMAPTVTPPAASAATPPATPPATLRRCTPEERGAYRIISATDTDATVRKHGDSIILGFNASVLATTNFVRGIAAHTGATPDGATTAPSVEQHLAHFGFAPERLVYDRAAGTPKHIADVRRASDGQTQLVAHQIDHSQRNARFTLADFTLDPTGLTCPNGVLSTHFYRAGNADGDHYRFLASQCQGCPRCDRCRNPKAKPTSHRTVFISDYAFSAAPELAYLATPAAKADFSFRANIERHIAGLTLHNGARRAKVCGLPKVNFQLAMAATAYNLKRWRVLVLAEERQGRREKPLCPTSLYPPT